MQKEERMISVHTPGPNKRVCGFLIDVAVVSITGIVLVFILGRNVDWFVWITYMLFKDCFNGQGIGKRLVSLLVVDANGNPPKPTQTIVRNLPLIVPFFPIIEYFVLLRSKEGRRLGDRLAKTRVHDMRPSINDKTYLWISLGVFLGLVIIHFCFAAYIVHVHPELLNDYQQR
jgi:uncharacterized RDD family membrane protein YckC